MDAAIAAGLIDLILSRLSYARALRSRLLRYDAARAQQRKQKYCLTGSEILKLNNQSVIPSNSKLLHSANDTQKVTSYRAAYGPADKNTPGWVDR